MTMPSPALFRGISNTRFLSLISHAFSGVTIGQYYNELSVLETVGVNTQFEIPTRYVHERAEGTRDLVCVVELNVHLVDLFAPWR